MSFQKLERQTSQVHTDLGTELMGVQLSGILFDFQPELVYLRDKNNSQPGYVHKASLSHLDHATEVVSTFLYCFLSLVY